MRTQDRNPNKRSKPTTRLSISESLSSATSFVQSAATRWYGSRWSPQISSWGRPIRSGILVPRVRVTSSRQSQMEQRMNSQPCPMVTAIGFSLWMISLGPAYGAEPGSFDGIRVGTFAQEVRTAYTEQEGLPSRDVRCVALGGDGAVYAGTAAGLARFDGSAWGTVGQFSKGIDLLAAAEGGVILLSDASLYRCDASGDSVLLAKCDRPELPAGSLRCLCSGEMVFVGTTQGLYALAEGLLAPVTALNELRGDELEIRQIATTADHRLAVAAKSGLYLKAGAANWAPVYPRSGQRSWAPHDVRRVVFDTRGRLWFASSQGVGCLDGDQWSLYTGYEGLPYNDFTTAGRRRGWRGLVRDADRGHSLRRQAMVLSPGIALAAPRRSPLDCRYPWR